MIEEGAKVDATDKTGQTPLMYATICNDKQVHTFFLAKACLLRAHTVEHLQLNFFFACQVALLLIRHGADVDIEDKEGYTVLGRASDELRPALIDAAKAMLEG